MLFCDITYINAQYEVIEHAWIGTSGSRISYIGSAAPEKATDYGRAYDGRGKLLINGFFNAHSHSGMGLLRGYGENMALDDWLHKRIFPFEAHLSSEDVYWGSLLCCAEMLRYGIVGTTDMYMFTNGMGDAFRDGGVKANFCIGAADFEGRAYRDMPQCRETLQAIEKYHNSEDNRIKVDFSMHAEYTSQEKMVRSLAEVAQEHGHNIQVHVSETVKETEECRQRHHGLSPTAYLAQCGIFDVPATAAHCVHVTPDDIDILREKSVTVATCPKSNLKLASGVAPILDMLKAGVNVALGTDSVASNNNLNFIEEMRIFSLLHKGISGDPTAITPAQALHIASKAGAVSQGRKDCGSIEIGNRADLLVLDVNRPHMKPAHNLLHNLIYAASGDDIVLTMVDGIVRYENGDWPHLDIEKIYAQVDKSCQRIISSL